MKPKITKSLLWDNKSEYEIQIQNKKLKFFNEFLNKLNSEIN